MNEKRANHHREVLGLAAMLLPFNGFLTWALLASQTSFPQYLFATIAGNLILVGCITAYVVDDLVEAPQPEDLRERFADHTTAMQVYTAIDGRDYATLSLMEFDPNFQALGPYPERKPQKLRELLRDFGIEADFDRWKAEHPPIAA